MASDEEMMALLRKWASGDECHCVSEEPWGRCHHCIAAHALNEMSEILIGTYNRLKDEE